MGDGGCPASYRYRCLEQARIDLLVRPRDCYDTDEIVRWLRVFLRRFFQTSQFKRSAMPNGPKVGSGGSLSPRGDWRAPSDSSAAVWLAELDAAYPPTA